MQPPADSTNPSNQSDQPTRVSFVSDFLKPRERISSSLNPTLPEPVPNPTPISPEPAPAQAPIQQATTTPPAAESLSLNQQPPEPTQPEPDSGQQILEELRDERDKLRGTDARIKPRSTKKILTTFAIIIFAVTTLSLSAQAILSSNQQNSATPQRQAFVLPADLDSKPAEERAALNIIELARTNQSNQIIKNWLGSQDSNINKQTFAELIQSYSSAADGASADLLDKKVGQSDLGVQGGAKVQAASLIYQSKYFDHSNNIYLKLNLYQPTESPSAWKLYHFEFKAEKANTPLKAEL
jgi:hypothetical protein